MAIKLSASMIAQGNQLADARRINSVSVAQASNGLHSDLADLSAEVALGFGSLTNHGWAHFKNLSPYGTISIGPKIGGTLYPAIDLAPGDFAVMQVDPSVAISATATQTCTLEWTVAEQ